jgi:uncharacterized protein (DUF1800 family)
MKPHLSSLALSALAVASCAQAPSPSSERTGQAEQKSELTNPAAPDAIRFLEQSSFGPTPANVSTVMSQGIPTYIANQMNAGTTPPTAFGNNYYTVQYAASLAGVPPSCTYDINCAPAGSGIVCNNGVCQDGCHKGTDGGGNAYNTCPAGQACTSSNATIGVCEAQIGFDPGTELYVHAVQAPDQLRQRIALALHQILVVSQVDFEPLRPSGANPYTAGTWNSPTGSYLNVLVNDAFANYQTILNDVSLNAAMGAYLNMVNNNGVGTGGVEIAPNENYARELMQLFSLGVNLLNPDGSLVLVNGQPVPTYGQTTIDAVSNLLTGWTNANAATNPTCPTKAGGSRGVTDWSYPLMPCDVNHDIDPQTLTWNTATGTNPQTYPGCTPSKTDPGFCTKDAFNWLLGQLMSHPNLAPFVCKQLIQQLVTANPSAAYVQRIVNWFLNDGTGVRGNMAVVIAQILEDTEARGLTPPYADQPTYGKLRSPALFMTNVLRWLGGTVVDPNTLVTQPNTPVTSQVLTQINQTATINTTWGADMGMQIPSPASVFSYYAPGTPLPGNPTLVGPEFGIENSGTALSRANFLNALLLTGSGTSKINGVTLNLSSNANVPTDPEALVVWLNNNMLHGTMSSSLQSIVYGTITDPSLSGQPASLIQALGVYLVAISPEYQIQR